MKIVLQIACAFLAAQVALAAKGPVAEPVCDVICPEDAPITKNYHIPYTGDCSKYCHCANNGNWKRVCPAGLHFNPKISVCDWPDKAGCDGNGSEGPASTAAPLNGCEGVTCGKDDCFETENSVDCQKYCDCDHGNVIIKECSNGLYFNPKTGNCDWEANVECGVTAKPGPSSTWEPTSDAPTSTWGPTSDAPSSTWGPTSNAPSSTWVPTSDAPSSTWGPTSDAPSSTWVPTSEAPLSTTEGSPVTGGECDDVCPPIFPIEDNNHLPFPGDCTKFCHCANNGNWTLTCPAGLHFNAKLQICDWPADAGCEDGSGPATSSKAPSSTWAPTTGTPSSTWEPTSQAPSSTWAPTTGEPSSTWSYSTSEPTSDAPSSTWGPTSDAPSSTWLPTSEAPKSTTEGSPVTGGECDDVCPPIFPIEDNNHLPYPGDCTKFCHCANNGNWTITCPAGLHFNAKLQVCDWPADAGCEEGSGPSTSSQPASTQAPTSSNPNSSTQAPTTEAPASSTEKPAPTQSTTPGTPSGEGICDDICPAVFPIVDNNHLAIPGDCTKFCHCANDGNWLKDCPAGLHFNQALMVCDWPNDANCKA